MNNKNPSSGTNTDENLLDALIELTEKDRDSPLSEDALKLLALWTIRESREIIINSGRLNEKQVQMLEELARQTQDPEATEAARNARLKFQSGVIFDETPKGQDQQ